MQSNEIGTFIALTLHQLMYSEAEVNKRSILGNSEAIGKAESYSSRLRNEGEAMVGM